MVKVKKSTAVNHRAKVQVGETSRSSGKSKSKREMALVKRAQMPPSHKVLRLMMLTDVTCCGSP